MIFHNCFFSDSFFWGVGGGLAHILVEGLFSWYHDCCGLILFNSSSVCNDVKNSNLIRPRGYKQTVMLNSAEHNFFSAHGILTFMSRKNNILGLSEPEKS